MTESRPEISISIINTNNCTITLQCLESIHNTSGDLKLQILVVNNACTDNSTAIIRQRFPKVEIIETQQMLGFSTNNNLAFNRTSGRYLLMLNDDTIIHPDALQKMIAFMDDHPEAGAIGPKILNRDGSWQLSFGFKPNPIYEGLGKISGPQNKLKPSEKPLSVGNVSGACMMVRSAITSKTGLLDTRFDPLYSEEIDWCYRITQNGWKIYYVPEAVITHLGGATMDRMPSQRFIRIFEKKVLFYRKHYGKPAVFIYKFTLILTNLIKMLIWAILITKKRSTALIELKTHWGLVKRALVV